MINVGDEEEEAWSPSDPDGDPQPDDENTAPPTPPNKCPKCKGAGQVRYVGLNEVDWIDCEDCEGSGRYLPAEEGLFDYVPESMRPDDTPTQPFIVGGSDGWAD